MAADVVPSGLTTVMEPLHAVAPAPPGTQAGVMALMEVPAELGTYSTLVASLAPKRTLRPGPGEKPVPPMVTGVPPLLGPLMGCTEETLKAGVAPAPDGPGF